MANNGRIRSASPVVNGSKDLTPNSAPASTTGSEYGPVEFTREDVEALLNERIKYKSKFNYKVSTFIPHLIKCINFDFLLNLKIFPCNVSFDVWRKKSLL